MDNNGCITCRKCEQVRSNFFCGRTRLSQKQLYNKHGFCSKYEPRKQTNAKPMTNEEWFCQLSTGEKADFLAKKCSGISCKFFLGEAEEIFSRYWVEWLKKPHTPKE